MGAIRVNSVFSALRRVRFVRIITGIFILFCPPKWRKIVLSNFGTLNRYNFVQTIERMRAVRDELVYDLDDQRLTSISKILFGLSPNRYYLAFE